MKSAKKEDFLSDINQTKKTPFGSRHAMVWNLKARFGSGMFCGQLTQYRPYSTKGTIRSTNYMENNSLYTTMCYYERYQWFPFYEI